MNIIYVEASNNQTINQDGNENANLQVKNYSLLDLIYQHLPIKAKVKNIEINPMRNGYIVYVLTSVDIHKIVKIGGRVIQIFEGVIYRQNFKISPIRKVIEKVVALRQNYKNKFNDLFQGLVELILNSLYGVQIRKDIMTFYKCRSVHWMRTEYDDNVIDYSKLPNGTYAVNFKKGKGLDGDNDAKNTLPSHLGAINLSNSKRFMNKVFRKINGFYMNSIYYGDTDSL